MRYLNAPNTAFGEDRRTYKVGTNANATDTTFYVSYDNSRVSVFLNGVKLYPGDDYTLTSSGIGSSITLVSQIGANNVLELIGYQGINSGNNVIEDRFVVGTSSSGSGGSYTGSTTVFNVSSSSGDLVSVWRNGVKLVHTTDFTVDSSASTVTLGSAASSADEITVQVVGILNHANVVPNQSTHNGKFLTTDGTSASWAEVDALPSQSSNSGKYLTTNGSAASWATLNPNSVTGAFTATDETIVKLQDGLSMTQTTLSGTHEVPTGYQTVMAGPITVSGTLTVNGTLVLV